MICIIFLGPDGSGKSTLLQNLRTDFEKDGKKIEIFHLMPRILEKAKNNGPVTNPHSKAPWPVWVSILKLIYYWLDYNLGYWLKVRPLLKRGDIVFFDRYYDDLLVDPRRYRYGGPMWLAKILSKFIPRPDLFIVLDVPEDEIIKRKQEVPIEEIKRQRQEYLKLACELKNAVIVDASLPPQEVARQAKSAILDLLYHKHLFKNTKTGDFSNTKEYLEKSLNAKIDKGTTFLTFFLPDGRGYLLPENQKLALRSLSLYAPQKFKAKALKKMLEISFILKFGQYLLPKICIDIEWLETFVKNMFGRDDLHFAISLGTPGPNRKPVVQVLSSKGEIIAYVKIGWNEKTIKLVKNEAETIIKLKQNNLRNLVLPEIFFASQYKNEYLLVTKDIKKFNKITTSYDFIQHLVTFSIELFKFGSIKANFIESPFGIALNKKIDLLEKKIPGYQIVILKKAFEMLKNKMDGYDILWGYCLRDVTPWNAWLDSVGKRLCIIDIEYAERYWLPGWDLFHFIRSTRGKFYFYNIEEDDKLVPYIKIYFGSIDIKYESFLLFYLAYLLDLFTLWQFSWIDVNMYVPNDEKNTLRNFINEIGFYTVFVENKLEKGG